MAAANDLISELVSDSPSLGSPLAPPSPPRDAPAQPLGRRCLDAASAYLPLVLMALLALGTWWLVKNTPMAEPGRTPEPLRHEPDYTMSAFMVQRFAPSGEARTQIEGDVLRHYPDNDTFEIDNPRIRAVAPGGRVTTATAKQALSNADGSVFELRGGARVLREATAADPAIEFESEFLQAFVRTERVRSHLPVTLRQGGTEVRADGMEYDNLAQVIDLKGRMHAVFASPPKPGSK